MGKTKGNLNVQTENIFPIIKKFLYSDEEIFLRELVSNSTDALQKIKMLASKGEYTKELGELKIEIEVDKNAKTLKIKDTGLGMTQDEVDKYINQIAFSGAEEFIKKYEQIQEGDKKDPTKIIGHFGLGFYSAFMVADEVSIISKSYKDETQAVQWNCNKNGEFEFKQYSREQRGTEVILYINEESKEYLEESKISSLLYKYNRFMPFEIYFGTEKYHEVIEGEKDEKGNDKTQEKERPRLINNTNPIWKKSPSELKDEDYIKFYNELYPMSEPPLFWIHLNVDYPFNLTGVLYFPKLNELTNFKKDKIQLYSNQVYVTDAIDDIVPEYLTLLHGVIDSPDIPLNVSRSALQADKNVKKISSYITRKVVDKLNDNFKSDRKEFENKWKSVNIFVKYGMLSDEKFYEKASKIFLLKDTEDNFFTLEEYKDKIKNSQKDKDDNLVWLYTSNKEIEHAYIKRAKAKDYNVLVFDEVLDSHFINHLEQKLMEDKIRIKRIDSESIEKLINKDQKIDSVLSEDNQKKLEEIYKGLVEKETFTVSAESLSPEEAPVIITQNEFMRRMNEMSKLSGQNFGMPPIDSYNLVLNTNNPIAKKILDTTEAEDQNKIAKQMFDLARLSIGILKGEELTDFINRSLELTK